MLDIIDVNDMIVSIEESSKSELVLLLASVKFSYLHPATPATRKLIWRDFAKMLRREIRRF